MRHVNPSDIALLVLRAALGIVFVAHGWNHLFGGGRLAGTTRWFAGLGMRPPRLHALLASVGELVAGVLLVLGFLVPVAGAAVVGTMAVAWVTNHARNGFFIFRPGEGYEYVMVLLAAGVAVGGNGGGEVSLDHLLGTAIADGPALALCAGALPLAALVLAACWRPVRGGNDD